jgi:predicted Co/Zn/Cd cation transporter (cation efflux family)
MNDRKFLEICKHTIKPLLDYITKDEHIKVIYDISEESKALNVKTCYDRIRDEIKTSFMQQPDGRIDRHKICACIYVAITTRRHSLKL